MTETLLQKLEEKTMNILTELEKVRGELKQLKQENYSLRSERENSTRKLQDLMTLFDSTSLSDSSEEPIYLQDEAAA